MKIDPQMVEHVQVLNYTDHKFAARLRIAQGFGMPSRIIVELLPERHADEHTILIESDSDVSFPTNQRPTDG